MTVQAVLQQLCNVLADVWQELFPYFSYDTDSAPGSETYLEAMRTCTSSNIQPRMFRMLRNEEICVRCTGKEEALVGAREKRVRKTHSASQHILSYSNGLSANVGSAIRNNSRTRSLSSLGIPSVG